MCSSDLPGLRGNHYGVAEAQRLRTVPHELKGSVAHGALSHDGKKERIASCPETAGEDVHRRIHDAGARKKFLSVSALAADLNYFSHGATLA